MRKTPAKKYSLYCEPCGYREEVADGPDPDVRDFSRLVEVKRSGICRPPKQNEETGKWEPQPDIPKPKMFKCPRCGRGVMVRESTKIFKKFRDLEQ